MADQGVSGNLSDSENVPPKGENMDVDEPQTKKMKLETSPPVKDYKLEERLNGILCCAVCLDLPDVAVYQCTNGHLMCAGCMAHLLADSRLKDETATCPNCRCEISKSLCIRNLAVEKAISELPATCRYCEQPLPRSALAHHETERCLERVVRCSYEILGCPWQGPHHEQGGHEEHCAHPNKSGLEVMSCLQSREESRKGELKLFKQIFDFLSFEKITFSDLQLRPYRSDDFITKLYYETSRFTAFNMQWVIKGCINDNQKNPVQTCQRSLSYQLVLKSKVQNPLRVHYLALRGPYGDAPINPSVHDFEFCTDNIEAPLYPLSISTSIDCNRLLSAKNISIRLIMFQVGRQTRSKNRDSNSNRL